MAHEGSPAHISSPSHGIDSHVNDIGDDNWGQDLSWFSQGNDLDAGGPSSVEVQPDLSSPRSISASSQLEDFNESPSPVNPAADQESGADLDIMGIANSWNDDDAFGNDSAIPSRGVELPCLGTSQTAGSLPWPSPTPLFPSNLDLFEDDRESVCELLGDVLDSNSVPGVCGLRNLGNTCFMNAGLQCLINTPPLLNYFHSNAIDEQYLECNSVHLTAQFAAFLLKMWSGRFSTLRPAEFKHTLSLYHPQFKDYRQHDCQEFLALLLDSLHEHLSQTASKDCSSKLSGEASEPAAVADRDPDLPSDCCMLTMNEEPMELYESSRSSQLSSPRSSSDSIETSSSCTTSCSSTRAKAATLALRSLPIPEEVKQPMFPMSVPATSQDGSVTDVAFKCAPFSPQKCQLVMERNMLNSSPDPVTPLVLEKNLISEINSMMKESKTANVNISTCSSEASANNEICFDSGKFPQSELAKPRAAVASTLVRNTDNAQLLSQQQQQQLAQKSKVKMTNVLKEAAKRLSEDQSSPSSSTSCTANEAGLPSDQSLLSPNNEKSGSKRPRFESGGNQEASASRQINRNGAVSPWESLGALGALGSLGTAVKDEEPSTSSHVACLPSSSLKESIVTQTFQGQFRSTVVCCTCKHVSVTYEPFMYLSVPLPRALERPVDVVFVSASSSSAPSRHRVVLQQYDDIAKLRQTLIKVLDLDEGERDRLILAEVANGVIMRFLEDQMSLRHLMDSQNRTVYAFAVPPVAPALTPHSLGSNEPSSSISATFEQEESSTKMSPVQSDAPSPVVESSWKSCAICLEEMADADLRKHTSCSCLLCQSCIEASCRHHRGGIGGQIGEYLQCPVCCLDVKPDEEFAPLDKLHEYRPVIRLLNVPIVVRVSPSQANATKNSGRLIGFPRLLRLPNLVSPGELQETVQKMYPKLEDFDLCLADQQVMRCPRCVYPVRCSGCKIAIESDQLSLQPGDCLAIQLYTSGDETEEACAIKWQNVIESQSTSEQHDCVSSSTSDECQVKDSLTLDDCLKAFAESETLDEGNPWFCPRCQKNQCASKTLSIYQAPPYLIVYLKRFVYHDNTSTKLDNRVEFPVAGLNLQPYIDRSEVSDSNEVGNPFLYDLYGVVCHFGSASSGHYTAYTRHVNRKDWHYYNDETVLSREPQEEDYSHGYVLFYQRRSRSTEWREEATVRSAAEK